jgi:NADH:ubiquinone oxidoreductase subunit K
MTATLDLLLAGLGPITLTHYLVVAAVLFSFGVAGVLMRRNAVGMLISVELILNAVSLNFVAFNRYVDPGVDGHIAALVVILLAACEAAIALAIVINISNQFGTIEVDRPSELQG